MELFGGLVTVLVMGLAFWGIVYPVACVFWWWEARQRRRKPTSRG